MIDAAQIRGARALLDWSTAVLAERTGLTVNGLNKIERAHVTSQRETLERIQAAFESEGVEFLPGSGVRRRSPMLSVLEGPDANANLAIDVYEHLKETGGELLLLHADEESVSMNVAGDFIREQFKKRRDAHITHRLLVSEETKTFYDELAGCYHALPPTFLSKSPFLIYGSKLALFSPELGSRAVIINEARVAESARKLFDFAWAHTQAISTAKRKGKAHD